MKTALMDVDALIRSIAINKGEPHSLFLGAGASVSSGVPSAEQCIWEWKRSIFLTQNPGLEKQFSELSLPSVRLQIQSWIDQQQKYPASNSPEEYGTFIAACYPNRADRRSYFDIRVKQARPFIGYQLLALLAGAGHFSSVWTTNFDGLAGRAAHARNLTVLEVGIDCQHRLPMAPKANELLVVSLHGDYRYDELKNTEGEVKAQETALTEALKASVGSRPMLVCGYSGRDTSILNAFRDAFTAPRKGGRIPAFYWCDYSDDEAADNVADLLAVANANGIPAFHVRGIGFDELMRRLALHVLEGRHAEDCRDVLSEIELPGDVP